MNKDNKASARKLIPEKILTQTFASMALFVLSQVANAVGFVREYGIRAITRAGRE